MAKIAIVQVIYNHKKFIPQVYSAIFNQTFKDIEVIAVIAGNDDGGKEYLQQHFPQVKIIDPGFNIGFAGGHNLVFNQTTCEYFQLVNPDLIMEPDYIEKLLTSFEDPKVVACTGKLIKYDFDHNEPTKIIDSTGVIISKAGHAKDRGQGEIDLNQYDQQLDLAAFSGAGVMLKRSAILEVAHMSGNGLEIFDQLFHSYFEDCDLSLRLINFGGKIKYNPEALAFHGRGVGSSGVSTFNILGHFLKRRHISLATRRSSAKNNIYFVVKNFPNITFSFIIRQLGYFAYLLVFETAVITVISQMYKEKEEILAKRKQILDNRKISAKEFYEIISK